MTYREEVRDSLDFDYQRHKIEKKQQPVFEKYEDSKKLNDIKKTYQDNNKIMKKKEYQQLKDKTLDNIPKLMELNDINQIVQADINHMGRDEAAENAFEYIVCFNKEMKILALSAF